MNIIESLEKLGFSFWQLLLFIVLFYLRQEIKMLIGNLARIKIGDKEVVFHQDTSVSDLKAIKEQVQNQPNETEKTINLINKKIDSKLVAALSSIRRETSYLWPAIQKLSKNNEATAQVQQHVFDSVKSNLKTIEDEGLLTYDVDYVGPQQYGILELRVKKLDASLGNLIIEAEKR